MRYTVGYWGIRGMGEPIILMLEYLEEPYTKKVHENREEWFGKEKEALGVPFPNLPYLIDGVKGFTLTQSLAILKYLGAQNGLFGSDDPVETAVQESLMDTTHDMHIRYAMTCYTPGDFEQSKVGHLAELPKTLARYDKYLAERKWLAGPKLFAGDFHLWSLLDYHCCMEPTVLDKFENVKRYKQEFENIPQIAKYLASDKFKRYPINGPSAKWGA